MLKKLNIFKKKGELCPYCKEGIVRNSGWGICPKCIAFMELGENSFNELKPKEKSDAIKMLELTTPPFKDVELYREARNYLLYMAETSISTWFEKEEEKRNKNEEKLKKLLKK